LSNFLSKYKMNTQTTSKYLKLTATDKDADVLKDKLPYFNSGLKDDKGNLWMTTYGGTVWKYDGDKLTNQSVKYGNEEALLISIYQDRKGQLWLGSNNAGVYKYKGENFEKFEFKIN